MTTYFINDAGAPVACAPHVKGASSALTEINAGTGVPPVSGATLLWSEDFSGPAGTFPPNWVLDSDNENMQANLASNVYQNGSGLLVLAARAGVCQDARGQTFQYSGAQIYGSAALTAPSPSYLEWYAQMPMVQGVWPTLWAMGIPLTGWPANGETDVVEIQTAASLLKSYATLHFPGPDGAAQYGGAALGASQVPWDSGWHKWGCHWAGSSVSMYLDEVLFWSATEAEVVAAGGTWEFAKPQCPYLSIYVGGAGAGNPSADTAWPVLMQLSYVRCYSSVPY